VGPEGPPASSPLGEADEAANHFEHAVRAGFRNRRWMESDPDLDSIRGHPRFRAAVAELADVTGGQEPTP
jgi:hypothetical protein